ncbi:nose resistant to fluoxetine protein 6-like isoform X1 [Apostichopus japonicus]|uniref:nose resistant to fluoxetine protein 6-like isoform X1 n=1 Tax=Stichopus japonicus TaxID=307972 RepID=UPI003AB7C3B2
MSSFGPMFGLLVMSLCFSFSSSMTHEMMRGMLYSETEIHLPIDKSEQISAECNSTLQNLTDKTAILKDALDAAGKPGAGLSAGNINMLGHFDECDNIDDFKYCMIILNVNHSNVGGLQLPVTYGLCVPEECSEGDVVSGIEIFFEGLENMFHIPLANIQSVICTSHPHHRFDWKFKLTLTFFSLLFLLVVLSSLYHAWYHSPACKSVQYAPLDEQGILHQHENNSPEQVLPDASASITAEVLPGTDIRTDEEESNTVRFQRRKEGPYLKIFNQIVFSFALPQNLPKLLSVKVSKESISCLHGIRVISMLWVILGHVFSICSTTAIMNPLTGLVWLSRYGFLTVSNAFFSVDSFFVMSGLLVTYITLKQLKKRQGKIPWHWFYFHRYWRLSPALAATMLFYIYITPYFGHGPYAEALSVRSSCPKYWWTNLLYINNFYPISGNTMCIPWVWYLANDMQFFIISPLILIPLYYIPWVGLCLIGTLCLASISITGVLVGIYDFPAASMNFQTDPQSHASFSDVIYNKPYCRITPYLAGMVLGYILYKYPKKSIKIHWTVALTAWIVACGIGYACIYAVYPNYNGHPWSRAGNILYEAFCRFAWGVSLTWVIFACHYGYGGWVNSFLGHPLWAPLGRLTYTAYLLHPIMILLFISHEGTVMYLSIALTSFYFAGITLISYGCAAILSLMLEFPLVGLEKIFLPRN